MNLLLGGLLIFFSSCDFKKNELGSQSNPIKIFFVSSIDAQLMEDSSQQIRQLLHEISGLYFQVSIPTSFIAVVEAFGTGRVDVAGLNTYGYVRAHEKYGAEARLMVIRNGKPHYRAQILARSDSSIRKLKDLNGKKMAFVDPTSASGYLLPLKILKEAEVQISESVFAMTHDNVVSMIYQGKVDAGATFYIPPVGGEIQDARRLLKKQYPDVDTKIKIIKITDSLPNEPLVFRKDMPLELKNKLVQTFLEVAKRPEGRDALKKIASITELKKSSDADYKGVRVMLKNLGKYKNQRVDQ